MLKIQQRKEEGETAGQMRKMPLDVMNATGWSKGKQKTRPCRGRRNSNSLEESVSKSAKSVLNQMAYSGFRPFRALRKHKF